MSANDLNSANEVLRRWADLDRDAAQSFLHSRCMEAIRRKLSGSSDFGV